MTVISPTFIAARYPLCVPDDTLLNDDQLIRYIRQRCGDEVGDAITDLIYATSIRAQLREQLDSIESNASRLESDIEEINEYLDELRKLVIDP